jgi:cytochrome c-type biogenesis protein
LRVWPVHETPVMLDISIGAAILGGLISFLSPCVLPLVPPYMVYITGTTLDRLTESEPSGAVARRAVLAALVFVAGFATIFVLLGASASALGSYLRLYADTLSIVAGLAILVMGLHFLGVFRIPFLMQQARLEVDQPVGLWGAYVMGLAFAFGWTPCIGPVLAAILAVAAAEATVAKGAMLLGFYSLGLGIPFVLAALAMKPFVGFLMRFKQHLGTVEKVTGGLLVLTGIAFLTGFMATASFWLLETFPALGRLG